MLLLCSVARCEVSELVRIEVEIYYIVYCLTFVCLGAISGIDSFGVGESILPLPPSLLCSVGIRLFVSFFPFLIFVASDWRVSFLDLPLLISLILSLVVLLILDASDLCLLFS